MNPDTYTVFVVWSDEDEAFIARAPDLPGCMAHGETRAQALAEIEAAIENWLDTARAIGRGIPKPKHFADYEKELAERVEELQPELEKAITKSLPRLAEHLAEYLAQSEQDVFVGYQKDVGIVSLRRPSQEKAAVHKPD